MENADYTDLLLATYCWYVLKWTNDNNGYVDKTIRESSVIQDYVGESVIQAWRERSRQFSSPERSSYLQKLKKEVRVLEHFFVQRF